MDIGRTLNPRGRAQPTLAVVLAVVLAGCMTQSEVPSASQSTASISEAEREFNSWTDQVGTWQWVIHIETTGNATIDINIDDYEWHDREQTPSVFALAASATSGDVLAAVGRATHVAPDGGVAVWSDDAQQEAGPHAFALLFDSGMPFMDRTIGPVAPGRYVVVVGSDAGAATATVQLNMLDGRGDLRSRATDYNHIRWLFTNDPGDWDKRTGASATAVGVQAASTEIDIRGNVSVIVLAQGSRAGSFQISGPEEFGCSNLSSQSPGYSVLTARNGPTGSYELEVTGVPHHSEFPIAFAWVYDVPDAVEFGTGTRCN